jgi:hypothetical protein
MSYPFLVYTILLPITLHEVASLLHLLHLWLCNVPAVKKAYKNFGLLKLASHLQSVVTLKVKSQSHHELGEQHFPMIAIVE